MVFWRRAIRPVSAVWTIAGFVVACHGSRPSPPVNCPKLPGTSATAVATPNPPGSGATPATTPAPSALTLPMALPEIPQEATCVIRDNVTQFDVTWNLRTRFDAVATMRVRQGAVTGWILTTRRLIHDSHNYALAKVENANALVRAWVTWEDLFVTLRKPRRLDGSTIADSVTERKFLFERSGTMDLDIEFWKVLKIDANVPCDDVGLARRRENPFELLPPKRGEVVVRKDTPVNFGNRTEDASKFWSAGHGVSKPDGALASVHHETQTQLQLLFETCGGWVYGWVDKTNVIGPPLLGRGSSNERCPNAGSGYGTNEYVPKDLWTCSKAIPIFVRTDTMQDPVGFVKVGAKLVIDDATSKTKSVEAEGTTRVVRIVESPVDTLNDTRLVANVTDLEACTRAEAAGEPRARHNSKATPKLTAPKVRLSAP